MESEESDWSDYDGETSQTTPLISQSDAKQYDVNGNTVEGRPGAQRLPSIILMVMKVACVFYHSHLTGDRRCFRCKIKDGQEKTTLPDSSGYTEMYMAKHNIDVIGQWYEEVEPAPTMDYVRHCADNDGENKPNRHVCQCCESYWWNYDGLPERYNDEKIGTMRWNHLGSWIISLAVICGAVTVLTYDFLYYVHGIWGIQIEVIHLISYGILMMALVLYPMFNLHSKIVSYTGGGMPGLSWTTAINSRFIIKRLQFCGFSQKGIPGKPLLALCYMLPPALAAYRGYVYIKHLGSFTTHSAISCVACGIIMWIGANFQYLMYLNRLSFQRQFRLIVEFIVSHQGDLDACRQVIGHAVQDFNCYRKFVAIYMTIFIPVMTWGITTQIVWYYLIRGHLRCMDEESRSTYVEVNVLCWSNISFFVLINVWAIGGFDVSYVMEHFRRSVVIETRRHVQKFWEKIIEFIDNVTLVPNVAFSVTMIFSALGFFDGLQIDRDQSVSYFKSLPECNETYMPLL